MMKNKAICIPFAFDDEMQTGVNIGSQDRAMDTYLKNASVALVSIRQYNPDCDVLFATNLKSSKIPQVYRTLFEKNGIKMLTIPFNCFRFPLKTTWSLAFYKLCALKALLEEPYDVVCYMDSDVFVQGSFNAVWQECQEHILLYDINHGLYTKDYVILCDEVESFTKSKKLITHYGGEFFAASKDDAKEFCVKCESIYNEMIKKGFLTTRGDEFIVSLAADQMKMKVKNAAPYIYRFWTGVGFHLVSTCFKYNRIVVLHMPAEKERGMVDLYRKYISKGNFPKDAEVWKTLRLKHLLVHDYIKLIIRKILFKMKK